MARLQKYPNGLKEPQALCRWILQKNLSSSLFADLFQTTVPEATGRLLEETADVPGPDEREESGPQVPVSLQEKIRTLEPLKLKLITLREEYIQKILAIRCEEKHEVKKLNEDKLNLMKVIRKKNEEVISLEAQVARLRKSLTEEYVQYRNESDARKVLLADLNELRYQQDELSLLHPTEIWKEDQVKLKMALKMARRDLTQAQMEMTLLRANFGDVVPRKIFEQLEKNHNVLLEEMEMLKHFSEGLRKDYNTLHQQHRDTVKERDQLILEVQELRRSHTPRPNWSKCPEVVAGGMDRWQTLIRGKNSDQLVDVLLEEIGERWLRDQEVFPGLGQSDEVPVYLRHDSAVKNKNLSKKEVVDIIKDIWKTRGEEEECQENLPEYFLRYIKEHYEETSAMEWTYSIYETIRIFRCNEVMRQFYDILTRKVDESTFLGQNQIVAELLNELAKKDIHNGGLFSIEQFSTILKRTFPLKKKDQIMELMQTTDCPLDDSSNPVQYRVLFREDEEGNAEPFIHKLRIQYLNEKLTYLQELRQVLEPGPNVNAVQLRAAFIAIDPCMDTKTLNNYLSQAFQCTPAELELEGFQPVETLLKRLQAGIVHRFGPQNPGAID
ncbi:translin-associated factor X-interacting protein 1 isoform X2 [Ornithorhynchus anatinus]|uniref:translin-associated factor X-interacting protein 1 isoform X2 n=1 Tax=Ornithorhynchus anatinus TaxID=9258 RepID=UPI0010A7ECB6|nr:translin-associated factor X-interacting protein 1 isoform X2 [Ornithorhynchus anatinus]